MIKTHENKNVIAELFILQIICFNTTQANAGVVKCNTELLQSHINRKIHDTSTD